MTTNSEDLKACETCNGKKWFNYYGSIVLCAECADHISPARLLESVEKERDELATGVRYIMENGLPTGNHKSVEWETAKRIMSTNEDKQRISIDGDKLDNEQK
jgi:hypothetical protein